ncbi:MAG TPA: 4a-hydroxytetrahydrobiopterin dehydratase [Mycobacteriales bacterium]|nr:4a-hydroxytetrahydrobiopterin dehydratase [Mycobacteriales bacterium]
MTATGPTLSGREIADAALTDWAYLQGGLHTRLPADFATGLRLVARIGAAAEAVDHHPDLDLRYSHLDVHLVSHDVGGVTRRDLRLARTISALAAEEGVVATPYATAVLEVALDSPDAAAVRPFWRAVLDMRETESSEGAAELRSDSLPSLWFQPSGSAEPRQHFHLDLWVAPEVVEDRIAAAVAAGGELLSAAEAPAFWVLGDADGNRVCLCTWQDRDPGPT